ncbi:MAG: SUMF1/EgtB/PvdO family nonheme iron enzyme [Treponema sp.]|nr:SUMF1/EgtB/PvdO family nonheme iron enzyme [Treponema sp.]
MERTEVENGLNLGDLVSVKTKDGFFAGKVEDFGESSIKLSNPKNGLCKRIAYDYIMEYDVGRLPSADMARIGLDTESRMVAIPGKDYVVGATPVTQRLYEKVMGENPSYFQTANKELDEAMQCILTREGDTQNNPVENVSWYDVVYFCNKLSILEGFTPAYSVDGERDPQYWGYKPHQKEPIGSKVCCDFSCNGYRLPTNDEWEDAAAGGEDYLFPGCDSMDEVSWNGENSNGVTHPVATKMANAYGLYDMSGNVCEWVWDSEDEIGSSHDNRGGCYSSSEDGCIFRTWGDGAASAFRYKNIGFRLLRKVC